MKKKNINLRFFLLLIIAVAAVVFTDRKKYFITDQGDPHHELRWNSVYDLTPDHPLDIVVLGNSHANTGVDPFTLSCVLGCTVFDMAPSGITIADAYYCLKELLTRTTPRLVVIETYLMRGTDGPPTEGLSLADEYRSFYPRRNNLIKLESLPVLFDVESYLPAWSFTLRNHELLLRNRDLMRKNQDWYKKRLAKKEKDLYLGRYSRFAKGINDSIMSLYETNGPAVDGTEEKISDRDIRYARKIVDLCDANGIEVMFFTLPMFEYHIGNYEAWRDEQSRAIKPTGKAWYNLQMPYLGSVFGPDCFEPTYDKNQHMSILGSIKATYKLAHYIHDELKIELPDRRVEKDWIKMFYAKDGYYENLTPAESDPKFRIVGRDVMLGDEHIIECLQSDDGWFYVKVDNSSTLPEKTSLIVEAVIDGEKTIGKVDVILSPIYTPIHHKLYMSRIKQEVKVNNLLAIEYDSR